MTNSMWRIVVGVLFAVLWLTAPSVAAGLDVLMQEFSVAPAGLKPAPVFSLKTIEGKTAALADYRRRPVLLYFWATW